MQNHDKGQLMLKMLSCLIKDAHASLGGDIFAPLQKLVAEGDILAIRGYDFPDALNSSPYIVKWTCQLEGWLKRFRFANDMYTDKELEKLTIEKFDKTQIRLPSARPTSPVVFKVLQEARKIVKEVLGKYDPEVHMKHCRFGSKAAKGVSREESYLDLRIETLSGSSEHVKWFKRTYLPFDKLLAKALLEVAKEKRARYVTCKSLDLSNVPKSWKSFRSIMPNTVIGNFHSNGMGDYLFERIGEKLYDLKRVQEKHKRYAEKASIDRRHVTVDCTSASDSYTSWLVNMLCPRDWLGALKLGRITDCKIDDRTVKLQSFMTMGIGFTFPLQTLLFYSIIRAVGRLLNVAGTYSVFGDDLIYPRRIHTYVKAILEKCGFLLNMDKTYVSSFFRESCGGDYFRGVNVRPCSPSGQHNRVGRQEYSSFLYKLANGLLLRWDGIEITATMHFLVREIVATNFVILQVPPFFPESSGLRVNVPLKGLYFSPVAWDIQKQRYNFQFLSEVPYKRVVIRQQIFMWDALHTTTNESDAVFELVNVTSSRFAMQEFVESYLHLDGKESYMRPKREALVWRKTRQQPRVYKSSITGKKLILTEPTVSVIQATRLVRQTGQSSRWS